MANSSLEAIRTKVRRLTRSPGESQITTSEIDEYINTSILYDFPEHLRLFFLRRTLTFYTQPGVDVYSTNTQDVNNPLYNFKNKYVSIHPPVFAAGIQVFYTQNRELFYGYYPQTNTIADTLLRGDGSTGTFSGVAFAHPMIQNNVLFTCLDTGGVAMQLIDYPALDSNGIPTNTGALGLPNQPQTLPSPYGQINYITGAFSINFPNNTLVQAPIYIENIAYQPGKPIAVLFYAQEFTIRPVPDKSYPIQVEVYVRPTELLNSGESPELEQWWQYIAYLAAKKIFEDRSDFDSVQQIYPELRMQQNLVQRSTIMQQANERSVTIYSQNRTGAWGWFNAGWPY